MCTHTHTHACTHVYTRAHTHRGQAARSPPFSGWHRLSAPHRPSPVSPVCRPSVSSAREQGPESTFCDLALLRSNKKAGTDEKDSGLPCLPRDPLEPSKWRPNRAPRSMGLFTLFFLHLINVYRGSCTMLGFWQDAASAFKVLTTSWDINTVQTSTVKDAFLFSVH